nr:nucleotidyl transferase AbiEii/AbiGii toxin family protein [Thermococcus sp. M39]
MPELSEFVEFVVEKSNIRNSSLVKRDILIHRILKDIFSSSLRDSYLFKGGSCLVKCYLGYYRFSVDLDFTWRDQSTWKNLGKKRLRKELLKETGKFGSVLELTAKEIDVDFKNDVKNKNYIEFGAGSKMVTFKLWDRDELIKVQVNFVEKLFFEPKPVMARTLIDNAEITDEEIAYFKDFLKFYTPVKVLAYSKEEILCEKVRAILTRRTQKIRDFYDVFMLEKEGLRAEAFKDEIIKKTKEVMRYKKYRENLNRNVKYLSIEETLENPFEREMFIVKPPSEFYRFLNRFSELLKDIGEYILQLEEREGR